MRVSNGSLLTIEAYGVRRACVCVCGGCWVVWWECVVVGVVLCGGSVWCVCVCLEGGSKHKANWVAHLSYAIAIIYYY